MVSVSHSTGVKYNIFDFAELEEEDHNFFCFKIREKPSIYWKQIVVWTNVYCVLSKMLQLFGKVATLW